MAIISEADLNYCVSAGIISRVDAGFYRAYNGTTVTGVYYKHYLSSLEGKLKLYAGIAERKTMHAQNAIAKVDNMKKARACMKQAYLESNSKNPLG